VRTYQSEARRAQGAAAVLITVHELALLFPAVEGAAFDELVTDIAARGLREKIVLRGTEIIDGRNRFHAAIAAGLFVNPVPMAALSAYFRALRPEEGDPLAFVLSANLHRRHLTESQRAMVAARLATLGEGRPARGENSANLQSIGPVLSVAAAGDALHVSARSVSTARGVLAKGAPELVAAVQGGAVSLHVAEAVAALPVADQTEIVARGRAAIVAAAKQFRAEDQAAKKVRRQEREQELAARIDGGNAALIAAGRAGRRYGVIHADPEWSFAPWSAETGMDRAADNHYPCSPLDVIAARPVAEIAAPDCVLFLWATAPMLPEALAVMAAWGFTYKSHLVWDKGAVGTGYWFRNRHELLLVGVRGAVPAPAMGDQWASVLAEPRGAHSAKPDGAAAMIEAYFPNVPKIELNARVARPGWDMWGAEAPDMEA
jgi:N6-adenosine-specific RNA methylase IME4